MTSRPADESSGAAPADPGAEYLGSLEPPTLEAIVEAMVLVAWADGVLSDAERQRLAANVAELTGGRLSSEELAQWLEAMTERAATADRSERLASIAGRLTDATAKQVAVVLASDVAAADGVLGEEERALCLALAEAVGLPPDEVTALGLRDAPPATSGPPDNL